jgi:hypothetical protein
MRLPLFLCLLLATAALSQSRELPEGVDAEALRQLARDLGIENAFGIEDKAEAVPDPDQVADAKRATGTRSTPRATPPAPATPYSAVDDDYVPEPDQIAGGVTTTPAATPSDDDAPAAGPPRGARVPPAPTTSDGGDADDTGAVDNSAIPEPTILADGNVAKPNITPAGAAQPNVTASVPDLPRLNSTGQEGLDPPDTNTSSPGSAAGTLKLWSQCGGAGGDCANKGNCADAPFAGKACVQVRRRRRPPLDGGRVQIQQGACRAPVTCACMLAEPASEHTRPLRPTSHPPFPPPLNPRSFHAVSVSTSTTGNACQTRRPSAPPALPASS